MANSASTPFRISSAPEHFQKCMSKISDDYCGKDGEEHDTCLAAILRQPEQHSILRNVSFVNSTQFPWPSYPGQPGEDISYPRDEPSDQTFSKTKQPITETPPIPITVSKIEIHLSHMPKNICFIQPTHSLEHPSRQTMGRSTRRSDGTCLLHKATQSTVIYWPVQ